MTTRPASSRRLVVCDVGGVLLARGLYLLLDELAAAAGRDPAQLRAFFADHQRAALWGRAGWVESSFWAELVAVAGPPEAVGSPARWRRRLPELLTPLEPGTAAVRRWAAAGPGGSQGGSRPPSLAVWLVTNHRRAWAEPALRASGVWSLCARRVVSEEIGLVKPDPAVYRTVLSEWGGAPADVLCVDADPRSVAAASQVGMTAVLADEAGGWVDAVDAWLADDWLAAA